MKYSPPSRKPNHECAGYLGYYTRTHLPVEFDLVDLDGCWPAVWVYNKSKNGVVRVFEEKPSWDRQEHHTSESRVFREFNVFASHVQRFVIWQADRLVIPQFPIVLTRIRRNPSEDERLSFDKGSFDAWICEGLET
jgi:hypothetical protein